MVGLGSRPTSAFWTGHQATPRTQTSRMNRATSFANRGLLAGPPNDFSVVSGDVLADVLMKNDLEKSQCLKGKPYGSVRGLPGPRGQRVRPANLG